ncbi:unnamed protein product [Knipowitschia caucasica]
MWRMFVTALCVLCASPARGEPNGSCPRKEPPPGVVVVSQDSELVLTCSGGVILDGVKLVSSRFPNAVTASIVNSRSHNPVLPNQQVDTLEDEFDTEEKEKRPKVQWKWNNKDLYTEGSTLSLSNVRMSDSGSYSCLQGGTEKFSTKVIVAEAIETPQLSCYKKSPSSKIRCEWSPHSQLHKSTSCSLFTRKRPNGLFLRVPCSYSTRRSKCWCVLGHNEEDKRTLHQAFLCVSSLTSNGSSDLITFTPMHILKPDPPYNVSVQPEVGLNRTLVVTWRPPYTWKIQDRFYELIYELRYKPLLSAYYQTRAIDEQTSTHTITDAVAGETYEVEVRAKDEYEGQWSEWSVTQHGRSWTDISNEDLLGTSYPYWYGEGSGSGDYPENQLTSTQREKTLSHHFLWIAVSLGVCLTVLIVYIIWHKGQCVSRLYSSRRPGAAADKQTLSKSRPLREVEERRKQELRAEDKTEATIFNNTSYFLVQKEI